MMARAAARAVAHKRVKRAMGLLRAAAAELAPDAEHVDLLGELRLERDAGLDELLELVALARRGRRAVDVVILSAPIEKPDLWLEGDDC